MKTKQFFSLFTAFLIFTTRVGYALNIHYCGDEIAEVSFAYKPVKCGMDSKHESKKSENTEAYKKSCCKDDTELFQNNEPQKVHVEVVSKVSALKSSPFHDIYNSDFKLGFVFEEFSNWNPPPKNSNKIFLVQQSLIFYD